VVFLGLAAAVLSMWRDWGFWPFIPAAPIFIYLVVANRITVRFKSTVSTHGRSLTI
jgi:hypothetical protein